MMSEHEKMQISLNCYASVSNLFARFINKSHNTSNDTWEHFIDIAKTQCYTQMIAVGLCSDEHYSFAEECGEEIAKNLMRVAGIGEEEMSSV